MGVGNRWPVLRNIFSSHPLNFAVGAFPPFICVLICSYAWKTDVSFILKTLRNCLIESTTAVVEYTPTGSISNFNEWSLSWVGPFRKWLVNHPILVGKTSISNCFFGSTIFKEIGVLGDMWSGLLLRRFSWKVWFLWKWMKDYSRIVGICSVFYINFFFHSGVLTQSE